MKLDFEKLFQKVPIDPDNIFGHASSLLIHKDDIIEVLTAFADEGIPWSNGEKATSNRALTENPEYEWYELGCWISKEDEGYRDICWNGLIREPQSVPQDHRYLLNDVRLDIEPPMPLSLELIFD